MASGKYCELLRSSGFRAFLSTQFLGALNDNFYKMVVSLLAVDTAAGIGDSGLYLSLAGVLFILPFILFSGYAGYLADIYNKRKVLIVTKVFEVLAMGIGVFAFSMGRIELMLGVLFLMALQSTFFSPAKYGILPEMLPYKDLSRANGLLEMSTFLAIILGTAVGGVIFAALKERLPWIGLIAVFIAVIGTIASLGISRVPDSGAKKPFKWNPWAEIFIGLERIYRDRSLWLATVGISYFWFLGALLQMTMLLMGKEVMRLNDQWVGIMLAFLAIGIGMGSLAAGRLSGDKIEPGLVPIGSFGMGVFSISLSLAKFSYPLTSFILYLLGFSAGLFIVPLYTFIQQRSGHEEKGRVLATNNFMGTGGILLASGVLWFFRDLLQIQADGIILIFGFLTFLVTAYTVRRVPEFLVRFILWVFTRTIYRIRIVGLENIPREGPALLVSNHVSFVDPFIIGCCVNRFIRFIIARPYYEIRTLQWFYRLMKAIPISDKSRKDILESLGQAREEILRGELVCVFAEGGISRTGNILPFKRGFEKIIEGIDVPVIPVHLDRIWGSIFSFSGGRFFYKWPDRIFRPVTVSFGRPMPSSVKAWDVRQAVMELGGEAARYRRKGGDLLHLRFIKMAKRRWSSLCMADSTGEGFTWGKILVGALLLGEWIKRHSPDDSVVGLLLPPSVAGGMANIGVLLAGKIPVNLNYTAGREAMASAIREGSIRTILTSRRFLEKARCDEMEGMVFLEEVMREITILQKILSVLKVRLFPMFLLRRFFGFAKKGPDDLATIIFTSGSTGIPRGVMLSHHNILSNIEGFSQLFYITRRDKLMGVLPFFHSFGFTGTLWFPLISGFSVVYHSNPLDAKTIGETVFRHRATIMLSTPTFCEDYLRKCTEEEFSSLRYVIVGGERLRDSLARAFKEKYGLDLLEGYGCTEMGPVVSVNIPDAFDGPHRQTGFKSGTVGHPIPGVTVKVVDPETGISLPCGEEGMLLVKGPGRMVGYLGQPERTEEVLQKGWYVTGDIASIDEDGFITIVDRISRFSKIGGEMIPHIKVEDTINRLLGDGLCLVTAIADKGGKERLVVLHTRKDVTADEIWKGLCRMDIPRLWIPRREDIYYIEEIPTLGSGKVDLGRVKGMLWKMVGVRES